MGRKRKSVEDWDKVRNWSSLLFDKRVDDYLNKIGVDSFYYSDFKMFCYMEIRYCSYNLDGDDRLRWFKKILKVLWINKSSRWWKFVGIQFSDLVQASSNLVQTSSDFSDYFEVVDCRVVQKVQSLLNGYKNPYDVVLFYMYVNGDSYRDISLKVNVDYQSVRLRILSVKKYLRKCW